MSYFDETATCLWGGRRRTGEFLRARRLAYGVEDRCPVPLRQAAAQC
jgi:hypothetical protein